MVCLLQKISCIFVRYEHLNFLKPQHENISQFYLVETLLYAVFQAFNIALRCLSGKILVYGKWFTRREVK